MSDSDMINIIIWLLFLALILLSSRIDAFENRLKKLEKKGE